MPMLDLSFLAELNDRKQVPDCPPGALASTSLKSKASDAHSPL
jgi:hypothetical protein